MARGNFFFERKEFSSLYIDKPYYTYLGYLLEEYFEDGVRIKERHPVSIYFGKDEIAVYYTTDKNDVLKIFSLYVAEGTINQAMLSKKIEDYARMPLWPLFSNVLGKELGRLLVDPVLLPTGFFASYYGFEYKEEGFSKINLPGSRSEVVSIAEGGSNLLFKYERREGGLGINAGYERSQDTPNQDPTKDNWTIENGKIMASRINFSKILLDFLFELDFASTFEDENFFALQPHLQNNLVLDALTKKCRYISELNKLRDFEQKRDKERLPKPFRDAERDWLNVCRLESFKSVFTSPKSLFKDAELEVKHVVFDARIGVGKKQRLEYMKDKQNAELKNTLCTFFMRKYSIWRAFRILAPPWAIPLFFLILWSIPLGDFFLAKYPTRYTGIFSIGLPLVILCLLFWYQAKTGMNLFKLMLPRLFLGIMIGWAVLWGTEELWKKALTTDFHTVLVFDTFLFIVIFMYIFTDIGNQMQAKRYKRDRRILAKTFSLMFLALTISFVIGFYVLQFYAKPMLENSGFLVSKHLYTKSKVPDEPLKLDSFFQNDDLKPEVKYFLGDKNYPYWKNYSNPVVRPPFKYVFKKLRYVWSVLLSQFIVAILIGVVLQLIWEDRPITEPL